MLIVNMRPKSMCEIDPTLWSPRQTAIISERTASQQMSNYRRWPWQSWQRSVVVGCHIPNHLLSHILQVYVAWRADRMRV